MARWVWGAIVLAMTTGARANGGETGNDPTVIVRAYKYSATPVTFRAAVSRAADIFATAGIRVRLLECWTGDGSGAPTPASCNVAPGPAEVILRVVRAADANANSHTESLGFALVDPHAGRGTVATVYADRVAAMARDARIDQVDLLARAAAHEIGHLLLGTNEHATSGLMRARWSRAELRHNTSVDWAFLNAEAATMRNAIAAHDKSHGSPTSVPAGSGASLCVVVTPASSLGHEEPHVFFDARPVTGMNFLPFVCRDAADGHVEHFQRN